MPDRPAPAFETLAITLGSAPDAATGAVVPPLHLSTTFRHERVGVHRGFEYARSGNPTRAALEHAIAVLEAGSHGFALASGLAAEDVLLRALSVPADRTIVVGDDAYGGTYRLLHAMHRTTGVTPDWATTPAPDGHGPQIVTADLRDPDRFAADLRSGALGRPALVWFETPTNPLIGTIDIAAVVEVAHAAGARVVVDNTFATPYLQQPLRLGADAVVHSATKYLGGHSDVLGGLVVVRDAELAGRVGFVQNAAGAVLAPFDAYLVLRGLKTLAVRMDRHCTNAGRIAAHLAAHPAVESVAYPGLRSDPGHAVAARQMRGFGGMLTVVVRGGEPAALRFAEGTRVFLLAESLGSVESLIEHPARMTHAATSGSSLAVPRGAVRLSVGLEHVDDLIADLDAALAAATA